MPLGIVPFFFDSSSINDKPDIRDRDGRFGHVRRYDYLTNTGRRNLKNASLIIRR
tara:strand:+ start:475 stop:639 length:165 start_codon:yes stop_codon:yes gene_type:complete